MYQSVVVGGMRDAGMRGPMQPRLPAPPYI